MTAGFAARLPVLALALASSPAVAAAPLGRCGETATPIHAIQGDGPRSPLEGARDVVVEAVVLADYPEGLGGFFLQEEDVDARAEGDPTTSEGLFVQSEGAGFALATGDLVRVRGDVSELRSGFGRGSLLTALANVGAIGLCGIGIRVTPSIVALPVDSLDTWERVEGMRIEIPQRLTVTENFNLGRFGQVDLSRGRLFQPTTLFAPGQAADALRDLNLRSRIGLDDGSRIQNPEPTLHPPPGLSAANTLRAGDGVEGVAGVLDHRFGAYRIHPVEEVVFRRDNPRPESPPDPGGRLRVAALNTMNYFLTLDEGPARCGPQRRLRCRGADRSSELARQRAKLASTLAALAADLIGLVEVENDEGAALADLAGALNERTGARTYAVIATGPIGTDAVRVGFLYRPATLTPVGRFEILDSSDDPLFLDTKNRPALAQTFDESATGSRFTAVVTHLKSKGSPCDDVGDPDAGDGQGPCNGVRTAAARALARWLADDPTGSGDPDVLILGDLNAYAMEDPVRSLEAEGYVDLIQRFSGLGAYSFVFAGEAGTLDYALASPGLLPQLSGAVVWQVNADEPAALDYNEEFKSATQLEAFYAPDPYRSSDHDPVLVGLDLHAPPGCAPERPGLEGRWPPDPGRRPPPALDPTPANRAASCPRSDRWDGVGRGGPRGAGH